MKLSARARRAARPAADRQPRRLDAQRRPGAVRRPDPRRAAPASSCAPPTWRSACASRSQARGRARRARSCCPPGCCSTSSRSLPAPTVTLELRAAEQDVELVAGTATFHIRTLRAEDFPPLPEPEADDARRACRREAFVETIAQGRPLGLARRDAPGPDRHPRVGLRRRSCGWSRPTPTASASRRRTLEQPLQGSFEANVPARALQELARHRPAARRRGARPSASRQNQVVFELGGVVLSSRLIDGQFPNYRQLLPETVRARAAPRRRRADRRRAPHQPAGAEERAAAPELQRGRADGLGADARRRRGAASRCRCRSRASRSRSASTPSSCATAWRASSPATLVLKLISPLRPGPDRGAPTTAASST